MGEGLIKPSGTWCIAYEKGAKLKNKIGLTILMEGDEAKHNYKRLSPVNYEDTMTFVRWIVDPKEIGSL